MASKIDQIKIGSTSYDIDLPVDATPNIASLKLQGEPVGAETFYTATVSNNAFSVTVPHVTSLYDGLVVNVKMPAATAAGATLDVNSLGAKEIYYRTATAVTTHIVANNYVSFVYDGTNQHWVMLFAYDSDKNTDTVAYQVRTNSAIYANKTGYSMNRYMLFFEVDGGLSGCATSITTGTTKTPVNFKYIPGGVIKYYSASGAIADNANFTATGLWDQYTIDLRYSFNIGSTLVSGKPVYVRMIINSDGTLTPDYAGSPSHPIVQALPNTEDGKAYVYLGQAYSTTSLELYNNHPIYEFKDGNIKPWDNIPSSPIINLEEAPGFFYNNETFVSGDKVYFDTSKTSEMASFLENLTYSLSESSGIKLEPLAYGQDKFAIYAYDLTAMDLGYVLMLTDYDGSSSRMTTIYGTQAGNIEDISWTQGWNNLAADGSFTALLRNTETITVGSAEGWNGILIATNDSWTTYDDGKYYKAPDTQELGGAIYQSVDGTLKKLLVDGDVGEVLDGGTISYNVILQGSASYTLPQNVIDTICGNIDKIYLVRVHGSYSSLKFNFYFRPNIVQTSSSDSSVAVDLVSVGSTTLAYFDQLFYSPNGLTRTMYYKNAGAKDFLTSVKKLNTDISEAQSCDSDESIAGSGTIYLHKIAKTGTYSDLIDKPDLSSLHTHSNKTALDNLSITSTGVTDGTNTYNASDKLDKTNSIGTGYIAYNHKSGTSVGTNSAIFGADNTVTASRCFAAGYNNTITSGTENTVEGNSNTVKGYYSHAEGYNNTIEQNVYAAHAEGNTNLITTTDPSSGYAFQGHVEGSKTLVFGNNGHAEGAGSVSSSSYTFRSPSGNSAYNLISGVTIVPGDVLVGTYNNRSDVIVVKKVSSEAITCNRAFTGKPYTATAKIYKGAAGLNAHSEGKDTVAIGDSSHAEGEGIVAISKSQHAFGEYNVPENKESTSFSSRGDYVEIVGNGTSTSARSNARTLDWNGNEWLAGGLTIGSNATLSDGTNSTTIANITTGLANISNKMDKANPTGTGSLSLNRKANTTVGDYSVAIGGGNTASNFASFAIGLNTTASGSVSYAEGAYTTASGDNSHAEGLMTIANHASQHVFGEYNVPDSNASGTYSRGDYVEIVGNGTGDGTSDRSNARTLDWSGNEILSGTVQATGFKTASGTSSQFLKANGSVDSNTYATTSQLPDMTNVAYKNVNNNFSTSQSMTSAVLSNGTPLQFTGYGTGTYNRGALVCNTTDKFGVECPRTSDSSTASIVPFRIGVRGGQLGNLQTGSVALGSNSSTTTSATISYNTTTQSLDFTF